MFKLIFEVLEVVPTVAGTIKATIAAYESATDTAGKLQAVIDGLEKVIGEIRTAIGSLT